ncbi:MAG: hypothetical protein ACRCVT_09410 [Leadbetterella sp.]
MKKIILLTLLSTGLYSQSIELNPNSILKSNSESEDLVISKFGLVPIVIGRRAEGTQIAPLAVENNSNLLFLGGRGYNGSSFTSFASSSIEFKASQNWDLANNGSFIQFSTTANGSNSRINRLTISNNGFVGVGTAFPNSMLHLFNGDSGVDPNSEPVVFIEDNRNTYLNLAAPNANETGILFGRPDDTGTSGGIIYRPNKDLHLRANGNETRMAISSAGNVGIGSITPTAKLDVNGDIVLSKKLTLLVVSNSYNNMGRNGASIISTGTNSTSTVVSITGIADGVDGMMLYIMPTASHTIHLEHENTNSLSANRIITPNGGTYTLVSRGGVTLIYNDVDSRWHVIDK